MPLKPFVRVNWMSVNWIYTKVSRSWNKPFSSSIYSPTILNYASIVGTKEHGFGKMSMVEETLTLAISPLGLHSPLRPCPPNPVEILYLWLARLKWQQVRLVHAFTPYGHPSAVPSRPLFRDMDEDKGAGPFSPAHQGNGAPAISL